MINIRDLLSITSLTQSEIDSIGTIGLAGGEMLFNSTIQLPQVYTTNGWITLGSVDPNATKVFSGLGGFYAGAVAGNTVIASQRFDIETLFLQHITSSTCTCIGAPTDSTIFNIIKIDTFDTQSTIGTIIFASGATVATFTFLNDVLFAVGDQMRIISPTVTNSINRISFNILGESLIPIV